MTRRTAITVLAIGLALNLAALAVFLRPAHAGACYSYDLGQWGTPTLNGDAGCYGPPTQPTPGPCVEVNGSERGLPDAGVCVS